MLISIGCFLLQQQAPSDIRLSNGIERLKKRVGQYRQHHTECSPRFDQTFTGACEQQSIETVTLQKRYLESKAKKAAKKADKKQPENASLAGNLQSSVHVVSITRIFKLILWPFINHCNEHVNDVVGLFFFFFGYMWNILFFWCINFECILLKCLLCMNKNRCLKSRTNYKSITIPNEWMETFLIRNKLRAREKMQLNVWYRDII